MTSCCIWYFAEDTNIPHQKIHIGSYPPDATDIPSLSTVLADSLGRTVHTKCHFLRLARKLLTDARIRCCGRLIPPSWCAMANSSYSALKMREILSKVGRFLGTISHESLMSSCILVDSDFSMEGRQFFSHTDKVRCKTRPPENVNPQRSNMCIIGTKNWLTYFFVVLFVVVVELTKRRAFLFATSTVVRTQIDPYNSAISPQICSAASPKLARQN